MKKIVLLGAGKSSNVLISYLSKWAIEKGWYSYIGDVDLVGTQKKIANLPACEAFQFDIQEENSFISFIQNADIVISMLPAMFHIQIATSCLKYKKHLITPSYISEEMMALHEEALNNRLIFMNEIGLDPGIDHMSAMKIIDKLHNKNAIITSFTSYCGGLIAPEYDNNPWHYKFTWNPRNVVLAGQGKGGLRYLTEQQYKYIPYFNLFKNTKSIEIKNHGRFEGYPNRDSLKYIPIYGLNNIDTMIRGTLRKEGFCEAWDILVQLGLTEDTYKLTLQKDCSYADFTNSFLNHTHLASKQAIEKTIKATISQETFDKLNWLDLFNKEKRIKHDGSPAFILQSILEEKLNLEPGDKDMIVMIHELEYTTSDQKKEKIISSLVVTGKDEIETAMAMTVGLPIGIICKMILDGDYGEYGVQLPISKGLYEPVLKELETYGIQFNEEQISVQY